MGIWRATTAYDAPSELTVRVDEMVVLTTALNYDASVPLGHERSDLAPNYDAASVPLEQECALFTHPIMMGCFCSS